VPAPGARGGGSPQFGSWGCVASWPALWNSILRSQRIRHATTPSNASDGALHDRRGLPAPGADPPPAASRPARSAPCASRKANASLGACCFGAGGCSPRCGNRGDR
jgi:hypothetical protein